MGSVMDMDGIVSSPAPLPLLFPAHARTQQEEAPAGWELLQRPPSLSRAADVSTMVQQEEVQVHHHLLMEHGERDTHTHTHTQSVVVREHLNRTCDT